MLSAEKRFDLHNLVQELAKDLCKTAADRAGEDRYEVDFSIHIDKSTYGNAPIIKYSIGSYPPVDGADLMAVIEEYYRRKGWNEANRPMVLLEAPQEYQDKSKMRDGLPEDAE